MSTQEKELPEKHAQVPTPYGFSHIAIPGRDLAQSKQFFVEVLGGDLTEDKPDTVRVQFDTFKIVLGPQSGGATPHDAEYPHYGFTVQAQDFMGIKQRLEAYGVPTHDPWGRKGRPTALMYFRDPSGNQFEMYCPQGFNAVPLRLGARAGGDYVIDFAALNYRSLQPLADKARLPKVRPGGFNHMTLPVRDMHEGKRFWVAAVGGSVLFELPDHITVRVGGADIGQSPTNRGWTAPDARYPHYTLLVKPEDLIPLKERLESYAIPTHDIWTRNGTHAAMYFRSPSGNLWEFYCESGFKGAVRRGVSAGGDYAPDVKALNYDSWKDPGK